MSEIRAELIAAERCVLVPLRAEHAAEMTPVLSDPRLYTFTGGDPPTISELRVRYERWQAGSPDPAQTWLNWVIQLPVEPPALAGSVQATVTGAGDQLAAEVAWIVGTPWQGQGLASAAAQALVRWLRRNRVRTITANVHPGNHASAGVAAAAGLAVTDLWQDGERTWRLVSQPGRRGG